MAHQIPAATRPRKTISPATLPRSAVAMTIAAKKPMASRTKLKAAPSLRNGFSIALSGTRADDEVRERLDLLVRQRVLERRHGAAAVLDLLDRAGLVDLRLVQVRTDRPRRPGGLQRVATGAPGRVE